MPLRFDGILEAAAPAFRRYLGLGDAVEVAMGEIERVHPEFDG